jgi:hypothetical protein
MICDKIKFWCRDSKDDNIHIFPVNPDKESPTAKNWANQHQNKGYEVLFDNIFNDVTLVSLDIRGQGGRAYQVHVLKDDVKYRCDIRETALLDIIQNAGIKAGGKLNGQYTFVGGASTTLVRIGSLQHKEALESAFKGKKQKIKLKDLVAGNVYSTKSGEKSIYLGKHSAPRVVTWEKGDCANSRPRSVYHSSNNDRKVGDISISNYGSAHIFIYYNPNGDLKYLWQMEIKKSSSFIEDHGPTSKFRNIEHNIITLLKKNSGYYSGYRGDIGLEKALKIANIRIDDIPISEERQKAIEEWYDKITISH